MTQPVSVQAPAFWNLLNWIVRPVEFLDECRQRYGDCFAVNFGNIGSLIFLTTPEAIEAIFTANAQSFDSGRSNGILRATLGDYSLLLLDGERHQRQRQLLMPPFHGERMRAYGQLICEITQQAAQGWQIGQSVVVRPYAQEISLKIILQTVFGLNEGERCDELKRLLKDLLSVTTSRYGFAMGFFPILRQDYGAWSPGGRFTRLKQQIDALLYAEIQERRDRPDPTRTDILSLLLAARDEAGQPMTDVELRDELMTLLVAGHETTATAIAWALYWIHSLPDVKAKLMDELATLGDRPDPAALVRLPYLNAVCSETLRIYPVALITEMRIAKAPIQILDYSFDAETVLAPCIYLSHHREAVYPDAQQFKPERFLERQFSPYEYFPFGGSNRRCIGAAFALYEMKLVIATLLSRYEFASGESRPVRPERRGVTVAPKGGVNLKVIGQRSPAATPSPAVSV